MDSHSVSKRNEEASGSNINGESESHLHMDPKLYDAAAEGDVEPFKIMANDVIESLVTVTNNTILHINIIAQSQDEKNTVVSSTKFVEDEANTTASATKFVEEILDRCPSLLLKVNDQGDTPLHVAVKYGRADIVRVLIERAKSQHNDEDDVESGIVGATSCTQMIGMLNKEKNTALHEAVCCDSLDIVKILLIEVPEFSYSANSYGETPLYMAAARKSPKMVTEILENCDSPAHQGPFGKTALHAAIRSFCPNDLMKLIVEKKKSLIRDRDQYGWTPLHYAAYFGTTVDLTKQLLDCDRFAACTADKDHKMTPLHLAAAQGHDDIMYSIISDCPECCELVDARGWNVLHFAMLSFNARQLKKLFEKPIVRSLINKKDINGNTPLHVLAAFYGFKTYHILHRYSIADNLHAVNKQNRSVWEIILDESPELKQEIQELSTGTDSEQYPRGFIKITKDKWEKKKTGWKLLDEDVFGIKGVAESQLIVATLIATVTFVAGFTLPGGYRSEEGPNQGTAILRKKPVFQAFIATNFLAMFLSLLAIILHLIMSLEFFKEFVRLFTLALSFTLAALIAMAIAFITGTYAILSSTSSWQLVFQTCSIGFGLFLLIFFPLRKAFQIKVAENIDRFNFNDHITR